MWWLEGGRGREKERREAKWVLTTHIKSLSVVGADNTVHGLGVKKRRLRLGSHNLKSGGGWREGSHKGR